MEEIFSPETTFADLGLRRSVQRGLDRKGYTCPTAIQAKIIPLVLDGRDVLGQAKTGTGKTAAFGLPLIHLADVKLGIQALILVPTRELAVQVAAELRDLASSASIRVTPIYGGEPRRTQIERLKKGVHIVVGTPGRVMDLHGARELGFNEIRFVVLDEVDRMLDIGFRDDIRSILGGIENVHQTIFVSATISAEIESLARRFMRDPEKVVVTSGSLTVARVEQSYLMVHRWDKRRLLLHLLTHEEPTLTLVFCATKREVDRVFQYLRKHEIDVHAMHGDMYQRKRDRVMRQFRAGELSVLIASDVAARGLDVDGISHVINYDIPQDPEVYVHRIGRTARLELEGIAWSFVTPEEGKALTAIERLINKEIPRKHYDDFKSGPVPATVQAERDRAAELSERVTRERSRTAPPPPPSKVDEQRFPGGLVPVTMPKRRMHGRVRGRRR